MTGPALSVRNLSIVFGEVPAVRDVSFDVARGECVGLVGESGSGKSTILRAIMGLVPISGGTIDVFGRTIGAQSRQRVSPRELQMVFQDPYGALHPRHTVGRILEEPLAINRIGDRDARIAQALTDVGLPEAFRFRYPHQLSGGQRQRVAIARALILEPEALLLDEPTSALDVSVQAEVLNLLSSIHARRGLTMLFVGHDLGVVAHLCTRLLVLEKGVLRDELTREAVHAGRSDDDYARRLLAAARRLNVTKRAPVR